MRRSWSFRSLVSTAMPFADGPTEGAYRRHVIYRHLFWDLLFAVAGAVVLLQHKSEMLQSFVLCCPASVPRWLQKGSLSSWYGSVEPRETLDSTGNAAALQCPSDATLAFPCNGPALAKLTFIIRNWQSIRQAMPVSADVQHLQALEHLSWFLLFPFIYFASSMAVCCTALFRRSRRTARRNVAEDSHQPSSSSKGATFTSGHAAASSQGMISQEVNALPAWMATMHLWVKALYIPVHLVFLLVAALQHQAPLRLLPWTSIYYFSSASMLHFAPIAAIFHVSFMLPWHLHLPAALLKWGCLTAIGCIVDLQLTGSATAGWRTYAWSLLLVVGCTSVAVLWLEGRSRQAFRAAWQREQQEASKQAGMQARAAGRDKPAAGPTPAAAHGQSRAAEEPGQQQQGSVEAGADADADTGTGTGAGSKPGAAVASAPAAAEVPPAASKAGSRQGSTPEQASSEPAGTAAAPDPVLQQQPTAPSTTAAAAAMQPCGTTPRAQRQATPPGLRAAQLAARALAAARQQRISAGIMGSTGPQPSMLYQSKTSRRVVVVSVKLLVDHGDEDFAATAAPYMASAQAALQQQAAAQGLRAAVAHAAAVPGCVHLLLQVVLEPNAAAEGSASDGSTAAGAVADAQLTALAADVGAAMQAVLVAAGKDAQATEATAAVLAAPQGPCDDAAWLSLPLAACLSPVCVAAAPAASSSSTAVATEAWDLLWPEERSSSSATTCRVAVGVLPDCPAGLPAHGSLVITARSASGSSHSVLGAGQVWRPATGQVSKHVALTLPVCQEASVLVLHLMPDPPAGAGPAGGAVHPVACLPLLALPEAASEEVLAMCCTAVRALLGEQPGLSEPAAARHAYWQHYVPFVDCWACLMAAAERAGQGPGAAAAQLGSASAPAPGQACLAEDARSLLSFLDGQGMRACLVLALDLVRRAGLGHVAAAVLDGTPHAEPGQAAASTGSSTEAADQSLPPVTSSGSISHVASAAEGTASASQQQPASPSSKQATGAAAASDDHHSSKQGAPLGGLGAAAAHWPASWRDVLLGFRDPDREEAYLRFKNSRCIGHVDAAASLVCPLVAASWALSWSKFAGRAHWLDISTSATVMLTYNLPWLLMLLARGWYLQHREGVLVLLGGASRLVSAVGHGVLSLAWGADMCISVPHCTCLMTMGAALHFPLLHHIRLRAALPLALVDAGGVVCYVASLSASLLAGLAAGVVCCCVSLAATALIESRSRARFVWQEA